MWLRAGGDGEPSCHSYLPALGTKSEPSYYLTALKRLPSIVKTNFLSTLCLSAFLHLKRKANLNLIRTLLRNQNVIKVGRVLLLLFNGGIVLEPHSLTQSFPLSAEHIKTLLTPRENILKRNN